MNNLASIAFIVPWYGPWPAWMPAFLLTCEQNPDITWIIPTESVPPPGPNNVLFVNMPLVELSARAKKALGFDVHIATAYKLCDYKPLYGLIFQKELEGIDFWGHADLDLLWGSIRSFITPEITKQFDVICGSDSGIIGHCTLYRNIPQLSSYILKMPGLQKLLTMPHYKEIDELRCNEWLHNGMRGLAGLSFRKCFFKVVYNPIAFRLFHRFKWHANLYGTLFFFSRKSGPGAVFSKNHKRLMIYNKQLHKSGSAMIQAQLKMEFAWGNGRLVENDGTEWMYIHFQYHKKFPMAINFTYPSPMRRFTFTTTNKESSFLG